MRGVLGALAAVGVIILLHVVPAVLVAATPEWLANVLAIFFLGVLPTAGFIWVAAIGGRMVRGESR